MTNSTTAATRWAGVLALGAFLGVWTAAAPAAQAEDRADQLRRGAYLARIMDCGGCHTPGALTGQPDATRMLGGSDIGFGIPGMGVFYPPNLTPHPETGIGAWSEQEIVAAVRAGMRPDGRALAPAMPWRSYAALTDEDALALAAYLKSLPPVAHASPPAAGAEDKPQGAYLAVVPPG